MATAKGILAINYKIVFARCSLCNFADLEVEMIIELFRSANAPFCDPSLHLAPQYASNQSLSTGISQAGNSQSRYGALVTRQH